jgi:Fe-S cluster biogenesis protein NfuA
VKLIKQILFSRVRPTVQDDGGDVKYISFDEETGVLKLSMMGSCAGCPSSHATLKNGIFKMMRHYVGEVKDVVAEDFKSS